MAASPPSEPSEAVSSLNGIANDITAPLQRAGIVGLRAGGIISRYPAVFSLDSKIIFHCVASHVRIVSVATGELLGVLRGHTARVTRCLPHPTNKFQVTIYSLPSDTHACHMLAAKEFE
jgi:hypothetical protein